MQFLTSIFGGSGNTIITAVLSLGIVLILIFLAVWGLKMVFKASSNVSRGRARRISVVDSMMVDPKRQLLIVRRDNVEHLILTGGPQDLVIETGIVVEPAPARQPVRRPLPPGAQPVDSAPASQSTYRPQAAPAPQQQPQIPRGAEAVRAFNERAPAPVRHPGLTRAPAERTDAANSIRATDKSAAPRSDSAKQGHIPSREQIGTGDFGTVDRPTQQSPRPIDRT